MTCTEEVIARLPVVVRRRVRWGECDPAGVVHTSVFADYVICAAEIFYGELFGLSPQQAKHDYGFGTPTRALSFDFQRSLRPDEFFDMTVRVADLRRRSYVLDVTGRTPEGDIVFVAMLTPICVARDERRSIDIPDAFRAALLRYREAGDGVIPALPENSK